MATLQHTHRINDVLFYIHQDLSRPLPAKLLANRAAFSEQHFHRVFAKVVGESVHQYIRRARLEFSANQLMFDSDSSVLDIATKAGFVSVSSFSRAFKTQFKVSPGVWRQQKGPGSEEGRLSKPYLSDPEIAQHFQRLRGCALPEVNFKELPAREVAYVRHMGYGRSIKQAWQKLQAWAISENRVYANQFGLYHSNPTLVELNKCRYVACIEIERPILRRGLVNSLTIPGGLHAIFHITGRYGELLPQLSNIFENWLPQSGFKMQATPAFVRYQKNQFLSDNETFELDFCLPISLY